MQRGENLGVKKRKRRGIAIPPEGFEASKMFSAALHQELLFDYKPEIAEKLAGEIRFEDGDGKIMLSLLCVC
jgi:hypothetical protein